MNLLNLGGLALLAALPIDSLSASAVPATDRSRADVAQLATGNTRFACDLYRRLSEGSGNTCVSPFSVSIALSMVHRGARGRTADEITAALSLPNEGDRIDSLVGDLLSDIGRVGATSGCQLSIADGMWVNDAYPLFDAFRDALHNHYGAECAAVDFEHAPEQSRSTINAWVTEHTGGKITEILPAGSIHHRTRIALVSAIYFKGEWRQKFNRQSTKPGDFHVTVKDVVRVPMMSLSDDTLRRASFTDLEVVELPYGSGDLVMDVIVPRSVDGLRAIEQRLEPQETSSWIDSLHVASVDLLLPRFTMRTHLSLRAVLRRMGMSTMFGDADLTGIAADPLLTVQDVQHESVVDVNEEGTEAAAATGVPMYVRGGRSYRTISADHPFLFLIRDRVTGSILFMGRVVNPTP